VLRVRSGTNDVPADTLPKLKITVVKDKLTMLIDGKPVADITITIDPTKKPKTVDMYAHSGVSKGKTDLAIYSVDGDKFVIAMFSPPFGQQKRPTEIPKGVTNDYDIIELQRVKRADNEAAIKELEALQGQWKLTRVYASGVDTTGQPLAQIEVSIDKDLLSIKAGDKVLSQAKLLLYPTMSPKALDLQSLVGATKGKTDLAIYTLDKDRLKIYTMPGAKAQESRPMAVPPAQEKTLEFMEFERIKTK
jgi:uncharacterized protein (TIGR03067 family)